MKPKHKCPACGTECKPHQCKACQEKAAIVYKRMGKNKP